MSDARILLIDDEADLLAALSERLTLKGYRVWTAASSREAMDLLERDPEIEVVLVDMVMPGIDGLDTLKMIKETYPLIEVMILTGHATVESAVKGIKMGAFDYLMKPCPMAEIMEKVDTAAKLKREHEVQVLDVKMSLPRMREQKLKQYDKTVKRYFEIKGL